MNSTLHFFHRPKTPTVPARSLKDSDSQGSWSPARSKRSEQANSLPTHENAYNNLSSKDTREFGKCSAEDEAVKPFDYLRVEDAALYAGSQKPTRMVETIHSRLLTDISKELPVSFNGNLCSIFESYRDLMEANLRLVTEVEQHLIELDKNQKAHDDDKKQWQADRLGYQARIKKLESILAHSCNLGESATTRKASVTGRRTHFAKEQMDEQTESLFDFLSKSRRDDLPPSSFVVPQKSNGNGREPVHLRGKRSMPDMKPKEYPKFKADGSVVGPPLHIAAYRQDDGERAFKRSEKVPIATGEEREVPRKHSGRGEIAPTISTAGTMGLGSTLSQFVPWNARKHRRKIHEMAEDSNALPVATTESHEHLLPASSQRELGRPFSFYHGDDVNFDIVEPLKYRQRSASLSEVQSPEKLFSISVADQSDDDNGRTTSLDTTRPTLVPDVSHEPALSTLDKVRHSKSSVLTASNGPRGNDAREVVRQDMTTPQPAKDTPVIVTVNAEDKHAPLKASSRKSTVKKTREPDEASRKLHKTAATAAAKAATRTSTGARKENSKQTVVAKK